MSVRFGRNAYCEDLESWVESFLLILMFSTEFSEFREAYLSNTQIYHNTKQHFPDCNPSSIFRLFSADIPVPETSKIY